ncbi:hypothetical protein ACIRRH_43265 [Kitasatospora sp. NPDC101235]|uniref:hypothetical protein n=1 Tax=Kitasatospora sp. NPDC101235 TaxID=3364101 RepID=UPI00383064FB
MSFCEPTPAQRAAVLELVAADAPASTSPEQAPEMLGLLLLALLLSANPTKREPVEDASEGVLQSLSCAMAF